MSTALEGHSLAGYRPGKKPPTEDAFAGKVRAEGFSGFSHFTGEVIEPEPTPAPASMSVTSGGIPGFSGFGHATGQIGGNPAIPKGTSIAPKKAAAVSGAYLGSL